MTSVSRPIVRWLGGKWKLAPWIVSHMPQHKVYVEPFGGAASVLLRKPRSYAEVYNDLDGEIVNLFRVARDHGDELKRALELTPFSFVEFRQAYEPCEDPIEQARRTVIRAYMGFGTDAHAQNTGFRSNSNRSGTTPAHDWRNYPGAFALTIERLQGVVIENRDAFSIMDTHDTPETLFYVDPPYTHDTRGKGGKYRHELDDGAHRALAEKVHTLKGMAMVSGYDSPLYRELYAGWRTECKQTHADGARARTEILWLSPGCAKGRLF